jgi:hypothetical protein
MDQIILQMLTELGKGNAFTLIVLGLTVFGSFEVVNFA